MPTRTINLKMVLGSKDDTAELRRALWTTHTLINKAVARIESVLLLCRGRSFWTIDRNGNEIEVQESEIVSGALKMARQAQERNGKHSVGTDEQVIAALRMLYERVVPSCQLDEKGDPRKGDAQSIGSGYAGPLFDRETCQIKNDRSPDQCGPFAETACKRLHNLPSWIVQLDKAEYEKGNASDFRFKSIDGQELFYRANLEEADRWYETETVQDIISGNKAFNKDGWKKKKEKGESDWAISFAKKQLELSQDWRITIRERLWKQLGLLPIDDLFFDKKTVGNLWNRLAFRLAVAHLLSWESWNHATQKAHSAAKWTWDNLRQEYQDLAPQFEELREYERERHLRLKRVAPVDDERPFRIRARAIRSWELVREAWLRDGNTFEDRQAIWKDLQTKMRGKFGDHDLYRWLASEGREQLWKAVDSLTPLATINLAELLLRKRKKYSLMTLADSRLHPRWAMYEAPGGTNLRNYRLTQGPAGLHVELPLLTEDANGNWREQCFTVRLAPSGQLSSLSVTNDENSQQVRFAFRSGHQNFDAPPGGAELLFDRSYMEHAERTNESLSQQPGPVWFKLTIDLQSKAPREWLDSRGRVITPTEVHHFNTALAKGSRNAQAIEPGLRVLSVDLGLRTFASCSVFELVRGRPDHGLCFPAADGRSDNDPRKLWARHERSFKLTLPGETPTNRETECRNMSMEEIRSIRRDIGRLKDILRLGAVDDDQMRDEKIAALMSSLNEESADLALGKDMFSGLGNSKFRTSSELWQQHCRFFYDKAEKILSARFSQWRKPTRRRSASWEDWRERRNYAGGKSIWTLEHLEAVRRLILTWNLRGRAYGEVNRQDRKRTGTVASSLLAHINRLKEDRTKTGADLLIQAARGFVPAAHGTGWSRKYEPCRVILFEDLARYRFRLDRPRKENSRLMKWSHRSIIAETQMQAELYGILILTTSAGFSSRYLASSGAPGVRCRYLTTNDFDDGLPKHYVVFELEWMLEKSETRDHTDSQIALARMIKPGMLVPWSGGELFATLKLDDKNNVHIIHADLNAAQNLQRRFWGRCGDAFRISCIQTDKHGKEVYVLAQQPGLRLLGALQQLNNGSSAFHVAASPNSKPGTERYIMERSSARKTRIRVSDHDARSGTEESMDTVAAYEEDRHGSRETFFRDPSGLLFNTKFWIPSKRYWSTVRRKIWKAMRS